MDATSGISTPESPASPEGGRLVDDSAMPRFECPPDFRRVRISTEDEPLYLEDLQEAKELWFIKTPQNFDVKSLNSKTVPLNGRQVLDEVEETYTSYELLVSQNAPLDKHSLPRLLLPSKSQADLVPGPAFGGQLSVIETVDVPPVVLPPSPPPRTNELPPGLKQRFHPFGWEEPKIPMIRREESANLTDTNTTQRGQKKSHKDKGHKDPGSRTATRPGAAVGGDERLAGGGDDGSAGDEAQDDLVTTKAHRKSKKRKQQDPEQDNAAANQSPANPEETPPKKKKKKKLKK
ncbi:DNA-directed RNA polymerase I subunit RPA34-like [Acanthaster planci]|uniref:DNA-directed RNA polymerase I subunit RPA34-like n=1 Tax=Acanthaster planci TaxID=133434 RepID=A0A8B7XL95_ACAPL|nr:DNA-directed RNA polymerase I subunit RPA34-like [Acanthaster planci]XP_022081583.1 DNA-directed RNA polymerase I subunit RPA34-like [Acanthaster planci]